jgi:hypothetical protein
MLRRTLGTMPARMFGRMPAEMLWIQKKHSRGCPHCVLGRTRKNALENAGDNAQENTPISSVAPARATATKMLGGRPAKMLGIMPSNML